MLSSVVALCASTAPVELHILPHTHADVGWLQTVNSLERINVSRILDGVTATVGAGADRRFVWDEMAFLQNWWESNTTTQAQRDLFSKYGWPAQDEIVSALEAFKAKRESLMQEPIGSEA